MYTTAVEPITTSTVKNPNLAAISNLKIIGLTKTQSYIWCFTITVFSLGFNIFLQDYRNFANLLLIY